MCKYSIAFYTAFTAMPLCYSMLQKKCCIGLIVLIAQAGLSESCVFIKLSTLEKSMNLFCSPVSYESLGDASVHHNKRVLIASYSGCLAFTCAVCAPFSLLVVFSSLLHTLLQLAFCFSRRLSITDWHSRSGQL